MSDTFRTDHDTSTSAMTLTWCDTALAWADGASPPGANTDESPWTRAPLPMPMIHGAAAHGSEARRTVFVPAVAEDGFRRP